VFLITDGDVAGAIVAAAPRTEVDLLMGIGGTPEGVIAAAPCDASGAPCKGACIRATTTNAGADRRGYDLDRVVRTEDLIASEDCFFAATGSPTATCCAG
jgi:fructose-1,6-bisphosphatase II